MLTESAALAERAGVRAVPRAGTWEISREVWALARYRQDPAWCRGELRVGQGWSGHRGAGAAACPQPGSPSSSRAAGGGGMLRRRRVPAVAYRKGY